MKVYCIFIRKHTINLGINSKTYLKGVSGVFSFFYIFCCYNYVVKKKYIGPRGAKRHHNYTICVLFIYIIDLFLPLFNSFFSIILIFLYYFSEILNFFFAFFTIL